ncbi:MAG TPA: tetratricopeptide repeat protein [Geobacteraceae bacterium]|nr:tetratricopeptide repeat protein [Geobacteraceae bacterium]
MKRKQKKSAAVLAAAPATPVATGTGTRDFTIAWGALIAALLALVVYLPALQNGFLSNWDDNRYILDNTHIQSMGGKFFRWACLDYKTNLWHPLSWISHAVDYAIWGLNPFGHHLTNIILHALNTGIVVLFTSSLLSVAGSTRIAPGTDVATPGRHGVMITSVVTGVLFAVHPIHVESVAWVTERKDLLYSLFYMLSIMCYCRYVRALPAEVAPYRGFLLNGTYHASLLLFFLALASKPMAVTMPFVLLVFDWYPLRRMVKRSDLAGVIVEKLPFFLLSAIVSLVTVIAQRDIGGLKSINDATPALRVLLAVKSLALYLLHLIFPLNLSPLYPYPKDPSLFKAEYLAALLFMAVITAGCIRYRKKHPVFLAVLFVFVASLLPVLGLLQAGVQAMADRFMYLACLGPLLLIGLGASWLWQRLDAAAGHGQKRMAVIGLALVAGCSLSYLTIRQIAVWKNAVTLWSAVIDKSPERFTDLYLYRGEALEHAGQPDRALQDYATAISLDANDYNAYVHHGTILLNKGELDPAIEDFNRAIAVSPDAVDAYNNRGNAYRKKGNLERALQEYDTAIAKKPGFYLTYVNRASAFVEKGEVHKAIADLTKVLSLEPELAKIYSTRGGLRMLVGNVDQALEDYNKACSLGFEEACRKEMFPF